eukprot:GHVL01036719.1.p1 GENE.GHVL01036719.1~~GHVL01036719.1.p1  ORF type:complete len:150 (+),score=12.09 GHVL01036719.1:180-629(+)
MVGDLKYGGTVHSLLQAISHFNPKFSFIEPNELSIPQEYKLGLEQRNISYTENDEFTDEINIADVLYMTRVQQERFIDPMEYEKVKNSYVLDNSMLIDTKDNLRILHPLPRINEIHTNVDNNPKAYYFQQAAKGIYARMATVASILGLV